MPDSFFVDAWRLTLAITCVILPFNYTRKRHPCKSVTPKAS
jgi:hypothetical protein